ncbi:MAG: endonuclease [Bacteroidia bacterium]|nr:endonuclease [Bacteroidia bacterium]
MKNSLCISVFLLCVYSLMGQGLQVSQNTLSFGNVYETTPDSIQIFIKNPFQQAVQISDALLLTDEYAHPVWSVSSNNFSIPAMDSMGIWVKFQPVHNVFHNAELILINDANRGPVRIDLQAQGRYSKPYYSGTENKSQETLKTTMKALLATNYVDLGYNGARDQMYMTIDNQKVNGQGALVNTVECVYTGRLATNYATRQEAQAQSFNTEHTFPQSLFSSNQPMLSDLYHIFPTDDAANSTRGNLPFGVITSGANWAVGGSECNGTIFEPRDVHKGKVARAMLYFAIRYQDYSCFLQGQEATLRNWHTQFLPGVAEQNRNNVISSLQNNRNPFIDYPQFIERISKVTTCQTATAVLAPDMLLPESSINYGNIAINTDYTYTYWIVNKGNDTLNLSGFTLGTPDFNFSGGTGVNTAVLPGEATPVSITVNAPALGVLNDTLTFQSPTAAVPVKIPVTANGINGVGIQHPVSLNGKIYPNPAGESIAITVPELTGKTVILTLFNAIGQKNTENRSVWKETETLSLKGYSPGLYYLSVKDTESGKMYSAPVQIQ